MMELLSGFNLNFLWSAIQASLPTLIAISFAGGLLYYLGKNPTSKLAQYRQSYGGLVLGALRWTEKEFENSTVPLISKADMALKKFTEYYEQHTGDLPNDEVKAWFNNVKEELLLELEKANLTNTTVANVTPPTETPKV